jgi:clorobiocin biosynthesis protein Clo-hal
MATAGFFPSPRAISPAVVGSLLTHLSGTRADLYNVFRDTGVPAAEAVASSTIEVLVPFRLDMRTEPLVDLIGGGRLDVYHDLVTDESGLAHRVGALCCRLPASLGRLVDAIPQHRSAATLVEAAPSLVSSTDIPADEARRYALDVLRIAAMKGFLRITPES